MAAAARHLPRCVGDLWRVPTDRQLARLGEYGSGPGIRLLGAPVRHVVPRVRERLGFAPHRLVGVPAQAFLFDDRFDELAAPCYVDHYLQNPRYFADVLPDVCTIVGTSLGLGSARPDRDPGRAPIVGINFRRGDYVNLGWALSLDYYERALAVLGERLARFSLMVIADDALLADLTRERLAAKGYDVASVADLDPPRHDVKALDDLAALAACDHVVMANSSFSWWGAMLGDHYSRATDRVVVSPGGWIPARRGHALARPTWVVLPT